MYLFQRPRSSATPYNRGNKTPKDVRHQKIDEKNNSGWSWLEKWMAAKPWESRLMEEIQSVPSEVTLLILVEVMEMWGFIHFLLNRTR